MTHTFLTAENIARTAAALVGLDLNIARHLYADVAADFNPGTGSIVQVPVPGAVEAHTRNARDLTTPLETSSIIEQGIPVTLSTLAYSNVPLAAGHLTLDITNFTVQVLRPQARAVAKYVEREAAAALMATPLDAALTFDATKPALVFTAARAKLRGNGVTSDATLVAVVGANVYAALLDAPDGYGFDGDTARVPGDSSDDTETLKKCRGFAVVESTRVDADAIVCFIPEAFALVVRATEVPEGAPYGASVTEGGFALTHIRSFDSNTATDRSLVQALVAVQAMPLAVDNEDGTVSLVQNGGAVRIDTTP